MTRLERVARQAAALAESVETARQALRPRRRLLTIAEVADFFAVSRASVSRWIAAGSIAAVKTPGGRTRIPESALRGEGETP